MNRFEAPVHADEWLEAIFHALTEELGQEPSEEAYEARLREAQAVLAAEDRALHDHLVADSPYWS